MIKKAGLTRIDAIVAAACVVFLFVNIGVITAGGRARAKKEVCLANMKALTAGWQMYAEGNGGKLVNGMVSYGTSSGCPPSPSGLTGDTKAVPPTSSNSGHQYELPWVGPAFGDFFDTHQSQCAQMVAIDSGALWKYVKSYQIYSCPVGVKDEMITYSIIDSMNGVNRGGTATQAFWVKNINTISKPSKRVVFFEEGQATPDSYAVYYTSEMWFDPPAVTHNDGTSVSFADGHSEYWKWKAKETIDIAKSKIYSYRPVSRSAKQDLYRVQIGCWTRLGYTPSVPVE